MSNYTTRQNFSTIEQLTGEDVSKIKEVFKKLSTLGYNSFQWSDFSQPMRRPGNRERFLNEHPEYKSLSQKEQSELFKSWSDKQPSWYFIEAFGKQFLRGEGETFLDCAEVILKKAEKIDSCPSHEFAYTHANGFKTCKLCGRFEKCTIDEALNNYKKGHIEIDEHKTLEFDHEKPLCSCGSHERYYLSDSLMPEKMYQCVNCKKFLKDEEEDGDITQTFEEEIESYFPFEIDCLLSEETWERIISKFTKLLFNHAKYVEGISENEFSTWAKPHFKTFFNVIHSTILKNDTQYLVVDFNHFDFKVIDKELYSISFSLSLEPIAEEKLSKDEKVTNTFLVIAKALSDED